MKKSREDRKRKFCSLRNEKRVVESFCMEKQNKTDRLCKNHGLTPGTTRRFRTRKNTESKSVSDNVFIGQRETISKSRRILEWNLQKPDSFRS